MGKIGIPTYVHKFIDMFFRNKNCIKIGEVGKGYCYYIYPIKKNSLVISGGVGEDISFEIDLYKKFNSEILIFDPTPIAKQVMSKYKKIPIKYFPLGLSGNSGTIFLNEPKKCGCYFNGEGGKCEFNCETVSRIAKGREIDLLKLDIEGSEYEVIEDILKNKVKVNQIVLEFHQWFKDILISKTLKTILALRKAGYVLIYKNIDDYTFIKKEILNQKNYKT